MPDFITHSSPQYAKSFFTWLGAKICSGNCPVHPNEEDFTSNDRNITTVYLPLNVTSLIQLIKQGVRTFGTQVPLQEEIVMKATERKRE